MTDKPKKKRGRPPKNAAFSDDAKKAIHEIHTNKKPREQSLPGMEDRQISELHDKALQYAEIRDERMRLNGEEVELKTELLGLMKKHKKETYKYNGVEINIVHEEESIRVRVRQKEADEAGQ